MTVLYPDPLNQEVPTEGYGPCFQGIVCDMNILYKEMRGEDGDAAVSLLTAVKYNITGHHPYGDGKGWGTRCV